MVLRKNPSHVGCNGDECNYEAIKMHLYKNGKPAFKLALLGEDYHIFNYEGSTVVLQRTLDGFSHFYVELSVVSANEPDSHRVLNELEKKLLTQEKTVAPRSS